MMNNKKEFIKISGVTKCFGNFEKPILKDINLTINEGEVFSHIRSLRIWKVYTIENNDRTYETR